MRITVVHQRSLEPIRVPVITSSEPEMFTTLQEACFDTDPDYFGAPSRVHFLKAGMDIIDVAMFHAGDYVHACNEEDASSYAVQAAMTHDARNRAKSEPGFKERISAKLTDAEKLVILKRAVVKLKGECESLKTERNSVIQASQEYGERIDELEHELSDMKALVNEKADAAITVLRLESSDGQSISLDGTQLEEEDGSVSDSHHSSDYSSTDDDDDDDGGDGSYYSSEEEEEEGQSGKPGEKEKEKDKGKDKGKGKGKASQDPARLRTESADGDMNEELPGAETIEQQQDHHHHHHHHSVSQRVYQSPRSAQKASQRNKARGLRRKLKALGRRVKSKRDTGEGKGLSFGLSLEKPDPQSYLLALNQNVTDLAIKLALDKRTMRDKNKALQKQSDELRYEIRKFKALHAAERKQHIITKEKLLACDAELGQQRKHVQTFMQALYKEQSHVDSLKKQLAKQETSHLAALRSAKQSGDADAEASCPRCHTNYQKGAQPLQVMERQLIEMEKKNAELTYMTRYLTNQVKETAKQLSDREKKLVVKTTQLAETRAQLDLLDDGAFSRGLTASRSATDIAEQAEREAALQIATEDMERQHTEDYAAHELDANNHHRKRSNLTAPLHWIGSYLWKQEQEGGKHVPTGDNSAGPHLVSSTAIATGTPPPPGPAGAGAGASGGGGGFLSTAWLPSLGRSSGAVANTTVDPAAAPATATAEDDGDDDDLELRILPRRRAASRSSQQRRLRRTRSLSNLEDLGLALDQGLYHGQPFVPQTQVTFDGRDRARSHAHALPTGAGTSPFSKSSPPGKSKPESKTSGTPTGKK